MISNLGFMEECITLNCEDDVLGVASLDSNNTVVAGEEDADFIGIIKHVRGGFASVQVMGHAVVNFSGELGLGVAHVVCDGDGGITPAETGGREILVLSVGTDTAEIIM